MKSLGGMRKNWILFLNIRSFSYAMGKSIPHTHARTLSHTHLFTVKQTHNHKTAPLHSCSTQWRPAVFWVNVDSDGIILRSSWKILDRRIKINKWSTSVIFDYGAVLSITRKSRLSRSKRQDILNLKIHTVYSNKNECHKSGENSKLLCNFKMQSSLEFGKKKCWFFLM